MFPQSYLISPYYTSVTFPSIGRVAMNETKVLPSESLLSYLDDTLHLTTHYYLLFKNVAISQTI